MLGLTKRSLLLDFDGVLYKNQFAHNIIAERSTRFCGRYLKTCSHYSLEKIHTHLYRTYGHTVLGLQSMGYDVTKEEYNEYVFSKLDFMGIENEFDNKKEISNMRVLCNTRNTDMYIFSNAPLEWLRPLLDMMEVEISQDKIIEPRYLKPTAEMYDHIEDCLPGHKFYFVDDNLINFKNLYHRNNWVKIHFSDTNDMIKENVYIINNLGRLNDIVCVDEKVYV